MLTDSPLQIARFTVTRGWVAWVGTVLSALAIGGAAAQTTSTAGSWSRQAWNGIVGSTVSDLTNANPFYLQSDSETLVDATFSSTGTMGGSRTRGYISPSVAGLYTFWVSGNDETQLFLSNDASKWNAKKIAGSAISTEPSSWDEAFSQRSVTHYLEAGGTYYVETLQKSAGSASHAAVAWSVQETVPGTTVNWATAANGAVASASSIYHPYLANLGIDGDPSTFFHTWNGVDSWWMVDLRQDRCITSVELINRQDCCQNRLSNFRVSIEDSSGGVVAFKDFYPSEGHVGSSETWTLAKPVAGCRVKVQFLGPNREWNYYLHLAEVQVNGPDSPIRNWSRESGVTATQSTEFWWAGYAAANAIDGNVNTFSHTNHAPGSSLLVDLGQNRLLDTVELINRQDGWLPQLSNFRVSVQDEAGATLVSKDYYTDTGYVTGAIRWELPEPVTGRKIKVELLGPNRFWNYYLQVAEVNAWGRIHSGITARGLRGAVPAAAIRSYVPALTDDADDNGYPDGWQTAYGFPAGFQTGSRTALADPDGDSRNNIQEALQGTDPFVGDGEPGFLTRSSYGNMPYYSLGVTRRTNRYFGPAETTAKHSSSLIAGMGGYTAGRVRGSVTPPESGYYRFWIASGESAQLWLATVPNSRFHKEFLCALSTDLGTGHGVPPCFWDSYASQMSKEVYLEAGKPYFLEADYQLGHAGNNHVTIAWAKRGGTRQAIPAERLSAFFPSADDTDDDLLPDSWERLYGLNTADSGNIDIRRQGEFGDFDADNLTNHEEYMLGTNPANADTDGDGISDFTESRTSGFNALVSNAGSTTLHSSVNILTHQGSNLNWTSTGTGVIADQFRGWVDWDFTVPSSGIWLLDLESALRGNVYVGDEIDFDLSIDGVKIGRKTQAYLSGSASTLRIVTPHLTQGTHRLRIFIDNIIARRSVEILSLKVLAPGGPDLNNNGIVDWVEAILLESDHLINPPLSSRTSPVCLEGRAAVVPGVSLNGQSVTLGIDNNHWYKNLDLGADLPTPYTATFASGIIQTGSILWQDTNVIQGGSLLIRAGDSLKLTARPVAGPSQQPSTLSGLTYINWTQEPGVTATQSTTYPNAPANLAIDGNTNGNFFAGSVSSTHSYPDSWWQVDLGQNRTIHKIVLWNRQDAVTERLSNYRISVLNADGATLASKDFHTTTGATAESESWLLPTPVSAQKIKVQFLGPNRWNDYYLSLAEVQVFGSQTIQLASDSQYCLHRFDTPGTHQILATLADGSTGTLTVEVKKATFTNLPAMVQNMVATWTLNKSLVDPSLSLEPGNGLTLGEYVDINSFHYRRLLRPSVGGRLGVAARVGTSGPITSIAAFNCVTYSDALQNDSATTYSSVDFPDYNIVTTPMVFTNLPPGATIQINIFRSGVMFRDGSTVATFRADDLVNGILNVDFLTPKGLTGGYCHYVTVFDANGAFLFQR